MTKRNALAVMTVMASLVWGAAANAVNITKQFPASLCANDNNSPGAPTQSVVTGSGYLKPTAGSPAIMVCPVVRDSSHPFNTGTTGNMFGFSSTAGDVQVFTCKAAISGAGISCDGPLHTSTGAGNETWSFTPGTFWATSGISDSLYVVTNQTANTTQIFGYTLTGP